MTAEDCLVLKLPDLSSSCHGNTLTGITLTIASKAMRITSKGQVTIPQHIREAAGFLPHTEVDFVLEDNGIVRIVRSKAADDERSLRQQRLEEWLEHVKTLPKSGLTPDEIMAMTRGEDD